MVEDTSPEAEVKPSDGLTPAAISLLSAVATAGERHSPPNKYPGLCKCGDWFASQTNYDGHLPSTPIGESVAVLLYIECLRSALETIAALDGADADRACLRRYPDTPATWCAPCIAHYVLSAGSV